MKLTFDHICDGLASEVKQRLNVQIVGGLSELLGEEKKKKEQDQIGTHRRQVERKRPRTRISSNKVAWSTLQNSWSQGIMSSVRLSSFFSSEGGVGCSRWYLQYSITLAKILPVTFGRGIT